MFKPALLAAVAATAALAQTTQTITTNLTVTCTTTACTIPATTLLVPTVTPPPPPNSYARPAGNTGTGLYVAGGRLNNPDGTEFRIRGVNRNHWDISAAPGVALAGANASRVSYSLSSAGAYQSDFNSLIANKVVPIAASFYYNAWSSCSTDNTLLAGIVSTLVANKSIWTTLNAKGIINIANEWGPSNSTVWRDQYINAVGQLRSAGFTMPLMIDTGGCGQNTGDLTSYAAAVAAADPQHNVIFSFHLYGGAPAWTVASMGAFFNQLAALSPLVFVIGEFGPGKNLPPSPTAITPDQVISAAESAHIGWMPWSWDSNDLANCNASNNSYSLTTNPCNGYTGNPSQLTTYGQDVVGQLAKYQATRATVF